MLVVTHNREIARVAHRVIELSSGRVVSDGPSRPAGRPRSPTSTGSDAPARASGFAGRPATCAAAGSWCCDRARARDRHRRLRRARQHGELARSPRTTPASPPCNAHDLEISLTEGTLRRPGSLLRPDPRDPRRRRDRIDGDRGAPRRRRPRSTLARRRRAAAAGARPRSSARSARADGRAIDGVHVDSGRALTRGRRRRPVGRARARASPRYHDLPAQGRAAPRRRSATALCRRGRRRRSTSSSPRPGGGDFGGAEASFAVVFTSLETAQTARRAQAAVNDARPATAPRASTWPTRGRELERRARRRPASAANVTTRTDEPAHRVLYKDAEGDQQMFDIFAFLILAGAALAAFNLATASSRRSGARSGSGWRSACRPRELAIRPLLLGVQIAVPGRCSDSVLGLLMGDDSSGASSKICCRCRSCVRRSSSTSSPRRGARLGAADRRGRDPGLARRAADADRRDPDWLPLRRSAAAPLALGQAPAPAGSSARSDAVAQRPARPARTLMTVLGIGAVVTRPRRASWDSIDSFWRHRSTAARPRCRTRHPNRIVVSLDALPQQRHGGRGVTRSSARWRRRLAQPSARPCR